MSARKVIIATTPNIASSAKSTAHGYMKTTSMSKMMKDIATR